MATPFPTFQTTIIGDPDGQCIALRPHGITFCEKGLADIRINVMLAKGTPYLTMYDNNGQERLRLYVNDSGEPEVSLSDGNGTELAHLVVDGDGSPYLDLKDAVGMRRLSCGVPEEGTPSFSLLDRDETSRFDLLLHDDNTVDMSAFPPTGEERWHDPLSRLAREQRGTATKGKED